MRSEGLSSLSVNLANRMSIRNSQMQIHKAQSELSSGRRADVNLDLGWSVSRNLNWRVRIDHLERSWDNFNTALVKADLTQSTINSMREMTSNLVSTLTGARGARDGQGLARVASQNAMSGIMDMTKTTHDGQYIFSGINTSEQPLRDYSGGTPETAVNAAFLAEFGFAIDDPAAINITAAQMDSFLTNTFSQMFDDPLWSTTWSDASSEHLVVRESRASPADLSADANEKPFRDMMAGLTAARALSTGNLGLAAFEKITDFALTRLSNAVAGFVETQSRVGFGQGQVRQAVDSRERQITLLKQEVTKTEGVDSYEVSLRINQLMTQFQASLAVTARLSELSLLKFI